ncbi:neuromedin-U receptor 2-like [Lytechinus pictus]|uniref:neuromedin-U receptor 2-like n=1 Tax=Lytechinus pictus TaxID=7653 RepID=UPI00240D5523|nr:neuromedin-U receptor 2-like [Lytechinus pictus]
MGDQWITDVDAVCFEKSYDIYNLSVKYTEENLVKDQVEIIIKSYVLPCVLAFGLFGNLLFLFVVARVRSMRTITNMYLTNLAIADLFYLSVGVGEKLWRYHISPVKDDRTPFGNIGCVFFPFVVDTTYTASVLLVTMVTVERYYAICKPFWHRRMATRKRTIKLIVATWIVSLCLAAMLIPGHYPMVYRCLIYPDDPKYDGYPSLNGYCSAVKPWLIHLVNGCQNIPFFIAMIVSSFLYTLIIKSLHARVKTDIALNSDRYQLTQVRNSVTKMLLVTGILFFLCLFPYQLCTFSLMVAGIISDDAYRKVNDVVEPFWPILQTMMYVNSAMNAYVYGITNARYRQALIKTFDCACEKQKMIMSSISMKSSTQTIAENLDKA